MQELSFPREVAGLEDWPAPSAGSGAAVQRKVLQVLRARRGLIGGGVLLGLALAGLYTVVTPKEYQASAQVMIDSRSDVTPDRDSASGMAPLEIPEVESQVELIRSEKIVGDALASLPSQVVAGLDQERPTLPAMTASFVHALVGSVEDLLNNGRSAAGDAVDPVRRRIDAVRDRLAVRRVGSSYVVELAFAAQDPALATTITNAVAASYVRDKVDNKSQAWRGASDWLQERLVKLGDQANAAAREAQSYKLKNQIVDTGGKGLVNEQQLQDLNTALIESRAKTVDAQAKLDQVRKQLAAGPENAGGDAPSDLVARLRQQYADLAQRKAQLTPDSDADRKAASDMAALRIVIGAEMTRIVQVLKSNYDVAAARQNNLETTFRTLLTQSGAANEARVRSRELDRNAETYESLYTNLLHQYTNAVNLQSFPIATARVISDAVKPTAPSAPKRGLALVLGLIAGAGLGIVAAFAREATDTSVRLPEHVEQLGVPCCAMLPVIDHEPDYDRALDLVAEEAGVTQGALTPSLFKSEIMLHMPDSHFAHAVQSVKTHIAVAGLGRATKVVGITSSRSGEGKSTIAANLSHLFAGPNRRTLLIDADIYNASLTTTFGMTGALGLGDVLRGNCSMTEVVGMAPGRDLSFLPAGRNRMAGHTDLLGSSHMARLLDEARRHYDCVIVDLPPVGEIVSTREVVPHIDGLVLVATWRQTKMEALRRMVRAFDFDRSKIVGVVLNKAADAAMETRGAYAGYQARMRSQAAA